MRKSKIIYLEERPMIHNFLDLDRIDQIISQEEKEKKKKSNIPLIFPEKVLRKFNKKRL